MQSATEDFKMEIKWTEDFKVATLLSALSRTKRRTKFDFAALAEWLPRLTKWVTSNSFFDHSLLINKDTSKDGWLGGDRCLHYNFFLLVTDGNSSAPTGRSKAAFLIAGLQTFLTKPCWVYDFCLIVSKLLNKIKKW